MKKNATAGDPTLDFLRLVGKEFDIGKYSLGLSGSRITIIKINFNSDYIGEKSWMIYVCFEFRGSHRF